MEEIIKLLLVEDDANLCYIIQGGLEDMIGGYKVLTASNGEEGLAVWKAQQPDVIVADIFPIGIQQQHDPVDGRRFKFLDHDATFGGGTFPMDCTHFIPGMIRPDTEKIHAGARVPERTSLLIVA